MLRFPLLLTLLASPAAADILLMKDGRILSDREMQRGEGYVAVQFENGEVKIPMDLVEEVYLDEDAEGVPKSRKRMIEKQLAEKEEQLADAIEHSEWRNRYTKSSKNFDWEYTIPNHIGEAFMERFEEYYKYFAKEWKLKRGREKMLVNFYRDSQQFRRVSGASPGALAYFRFVGRYDLNACYDRIDPVETEMILYHELSHYVQKLIDEDFKMPHWPGEGISEYYGGALWNEDKGNFEWGLIQEGRLTEVQQDILRGKFLTIKDIVMEDAYTDYTWGWALIYFLMEDKGLASDFKKYFLGLARDKGVKRVDYAFNLKTVAPAERWRWFRECLDLEDEEDVQELQDEFYTYLQEELKLETASGLEKAGIAAKRASMPIKARRLFSEAQEKGGLTALGCHHYAQLARRKDKKLARELYQQATELDPLTGTYWYKLAELTEDEDEAERLKALAKELDPEVDTWVVDLVFEDEE